MKSTYHLPIYSITHFLLERTMVNMSVYWCCEAQIDSRRESKRDPVLILA